MMVGMDTRFIFFMANAQADLSLHWSHKCYCRFCRTVVHILFYANLNLEEILVKTVNSFRQFQMQNAITVLIYLQLNKLLNYR